MGNSTGLLFKGMIFVGCCQVSSFLIFLFLNWDREKNRLWIDAYTF